MKHKPIKLTSKQRQFLHLGEPSSSTNRFLKLKQAGTGYDPQGSLIEFINHDLITPLCKSRSDLSVYKPPISPLNQMRNKFALNTDIILTDITTIPKIQQYKYYNFINRSKLNEQIQKQKEQEIEKLKTREYPFLSLKSKYGSHSEGLNHWIPHSTQNS